MTFSWNVTFQTLAAFAGGYAFAIATSFAMIPISLLLFTDNKHDAVFIGLLSSYLFYMLAIVWCFCQKSALLAWRDIILASTGCLAIFLYFPSF